MKVYYFRGEVNLKEQMINYNCKVCGASSKLHGFWIKHNEHEEFLCDNCTFWYYEVSGQWQKFKLNAPIVEMMMRR